MSTAEPHPDRLLGSDAAVRRIAGALYDEVAAAPIISPHGHVSAKMLALDAPFGDPAALFVTPDHYVTRLLHASGIPLDRLGLGDSHTPPREIWRTLCSHWFRFAGTPVRYWLEDALSRVFGIAAPIRPATADELYDELVERLAEPEYRPRALLERFGVELLATTDDPADSLEHHERLESAVSTAVVPTLRADAYMSPDGPDWPQKLEQLSAVTGQECATYRGLLDAIRARRAAFAARGATATDCGVPDAWAIELSDEQAEALHRDGVAGTITPEGARAYRRNMVFQFGRMAAEDGLVMQLHAGVIRNHHRPTFDRFGPDTGHDVPGVTEFSEPLRALLNDVGTSPRFQLVLFTVDESALSRDIAPLAGFYPSVYAGAPWWFLDAPAAVRRYREAVTETAGFYKTSGFVDDTRALCSIPSRHDMSRRLDARYLAELVVDRRLDESEASVIARALVSEIPRTAFRLT